MRVPDAASSTLAEIAKEILRNGYAFRPRETMLPILSGPELDEWGSFAASWDDLGQDTYMADGGRYRRRRFAAFEICGDKIIREPHQPHYQSRDYNPLNGGIIRWFEPVYETIAAHAFTQRLLATCRHIFDDTTTKTDGQQVWHVEMHQFRIEASQQHAGLPTPEGIHRDGVNWVCVVLVRRRNVASGITQIYSRTEPLGAFTLTDPLDTVFIDDERVLHGVTPIHALDPGLNAFRDVLVLTFRKRHERTKRSSD
ncbi:MAG: 2OG-Fe dioxygenase family protein [Alphaproteobacteria bacterium]|nr:2OG-Fe dioxygenase family protein [Alphaproteobacteria bacterium]